MKQILIPTDFSENAWNALKYGLKLLEGMECSICLLHINPIPTYSAAESGVRPKMDDLTELVLTKSREDLQELLAKIKKLPIKHNFKFEILALHDFFNDAIKRVSEAKKVDLIIMGTKGATGLKGATIGSNTGNVLTKIKRPLLAVPEEAFFKKPFEVSFVTDFLINYDGRVLDTLTDLARSNKSSIRVMHMQKDGEELTAEQTKNKELLTRWFDHIDHSFHILTGSKLEIAIQHFIESRNIDMIAMVAKNLNFFQRILFRPEVEKISYHTRVPFLVFHE